MEFRPPHSHLWTTLVANIRRCGFQETLCSTLCIVCISLFKTLLPLLTQFLIQHSTRLAISNTRPRRAVARRHYDQIVAWCQMHCPRVVHSTLSLTLSVVIDSNCLSSTLSKHISPSVIGKTLSTTFFPPVGRHFLRFTVATPICFPNFSPTSQSRH